MIAGLVGRLECAHEQLVRGGVGIELARGDAIDHRAALAGRQDPPVGGVVLIDVDSEERALEILADDPYVTSGVAEYQALGWNPRRGSLKDHLKV